MTNQRMMQLLADWQVYMTHSTNKLGYPVKSLGIANGAGNLTFDDMINDMDVSNSRELDVIIDGLPLMQKQAVHFKHGIITFYSRDENLDYQYGMAIDNLCVIANRRGMI